MLTRRALLNAAAAMAAPWATLAHAAANLPGVSKMMVGFPAGTSVDIIARRYADKLQGTYAETLIIENLSGAGGQIALERFKGAAPDGRTLMMLPSPLLTLYPWVYEKLRYDPLRDYEAVATVYQSTVGVAIGPSVPESVTNLKQFIEWAKGRKESIFFSANAQGAGPHFAGLQFARSAGFTAEYVPYQGGTPAMVALMGGQLPMVCITMGTIAPLISSGKVRVLGIFDNERSPLYPEIPTLKEQGYPELVESEFGVVIVPTGTPRNVIADLEQALSAAMALPDLQKGMRDQYMRAQFAGSAATTVALKSDSERWRKTVTDFHFTPMSS